MPRLTLIIVTYERPDALAAVLGSVARQSEAPDEVVIADDGSGAATRAVIERFAAAARFPVLHARQEHEGFRVCHVRNLAIARASGDYLLQIDGDMVLHPRFVMDHRRAVRRGCFVQGTRILADERLTRQLLAGSGRRITPFTAGVGALRRLYAARLPLLSRACRVLANGFVAVKACNQGFWREDLERVNGYNEEMTGWGSEDKELAARLQHAGVQRRTLLFGGIACHLHHPAAARDRHQVNQAILMQTRAQRRVRCVHGLDRQRAAARQPPPGSVL